MQNNEFHVSDFELQFYRNSLQEYCRGVFKMLWKRCSKSFMALLLCCSLLFGIQSPVPANAATVQTATDIVNNMTERDKITQILMPAFGSGKKAVGLIIPT